MTMPYKRTPGGGAPNSELEDPELEGPEPVDPELEGPEPAEGPETSLYPLCTPVGAQWGVLLFLINFCNNFSN